MRERQWIRFGPRAAACASLAAGALGLLSCANTPVHEVDKPEEVKGIACYRPAHFILVAFNGKGYVATHEILPDTSGPMLSIKPYAWMAQNKSTLTFTNGCLDGAEIATDETAVPSAIIEAAKTAALAAVKAKGGGAMAPKAFSGLESAAEGGKSGPGKVDYDVTIPAPVLIRLDYDKSLGHWLLATGDKPISIKVEPVK